MFALIWIYFSYSSKIKKHSRVFVYHGNLDEVPENAALMCIVGSQGHDCQLNLGKLN